MMGRRNGNQGHLFYEFRLDEAVPDDHLVRKIGAVLDLSWVHGELEPYYSEVGRPSLDPALMIRMLIVGYVFAIRSERQLCREVQVNLAYRWFCELGLEDRIPDHSAFSRARNLRFREGDVFRHVFERVVGSCIEVGLVGGEGFAVDASIIEADANRQRSIPGKEWHKERDLEGASRAVKDYLATLNDAAFGAATEVEPKFVSPSDPAAQWTGALKGPAFFAYADNYLIDVRFGVIVDVEASRAIRQAEVGAARTMLERTEERFGLKPQRLAADSAYGSAPMLNWLVEKKAIAPTFPSSINRTERMAPSHAAISGTTPRETPTIVRRVRNFEPVARCMKARRCFTARASSTAIDAPSSHAAVLKNPHARSRAIFTSTPATWPAHSLELKRSSNRGVIASALRCGSLTSSVSCGSIAFDSGARAGHKTSLLWRPSPRT